MKILNIITIAWKELTHGPSVLSYASNHKINCSFIAEISSFIRAFYGRLIELTKGSLRKSTAKLSLTRNKLRKILTQVEAVV